MPLHMSKMTEILSRISSLSAQLHNPDGISDQDYDNHIRALLEYLREVMPNEASDIISGENSLLDKLDPSLHSLSYLFIWHLQVQSVRGRGGDCFSEDIRPGGNLWSKGIRLLMSFNPIQIRYAGREWRELVELLAQSALSVSKPLLAVQAIQSAILRLEPSCTTFTSTHLLFVKLCLHAKAHAYALPVLDKPTCHFVTGSEQSHLENDQSLLCAYLEYSPQTSIHGFSAELTYKEHLEYFLYGAMIYMALKQWKKALHLLAIVISSPVVNSVSMIMVEAYKKWVLTSLLENGKLMQSPEAISPHTMKIYRSLARPYITLAEAFEVNDFLKLNAEVQVGQSIWHMDSNTGLVIQVVGACEKFTLYRLGKTFAALTMADATQWVGAHSISVSDMESFVASLIMSMALNATLSHSCDSAKPTMLRFLGSTSRSSVLKESHMQARLIEGCLSLASLMNNIGRGSNSLEMSNEHIESLLRGQKQAGSALKNSVVGELGGFDVDEDIMRDVC